MLDTSGVNPSKIRILISGLGGDTGQGVVKALKNSNLPVEIFGMCIRAESPFLYQVDYGLISPKSASPEYIPFLIQTIIKNSIDLFIPTVDSEILLISRNKNRIESETNSKIFIGNADHIAIANDKYLTALYLEEIGVMHPKTVLANDSKGVNELFRCGFPIVVKPRIGNGSVGVLTAASLTELESYLGREDLVFQEWLDPSGGEITTGMYTSQATGDNLRCSLLRELRNGSTFIATRIIDDSLERPLQKIASKMDIPYINIQSMRLDAGLSVFEINPRLSGTTAIVSRVFNPVELYIREVILGESASLAINDETFVAMRYLEEHYETVERVNQFKLLGFKT
jgi:carbamoyl-phosphate synthase large subunit